MLYMCLRDGVAKMGTAWGAARWHTGTWGGAGGWRSRGGACPACPAGCRRHGRRRLALALLPLLPFQVLQRGGEEVEVSFRLHRGASGVPRTIAIELVLSHHTAPARACTRRYAPLAHSAAAAAPGDYCKR